jgi:hypothetical protein
MYSNVSYRLTVLEKICRYYKEATIEMKTIWYVAAAVAVVALGIRVAFMKGPGSLSVHYASSPETLSCNKTIRRSSLLRFSFPV